MSEDIPLWQKQIDEIIANEGFDKFQPLRETKGQYLTKGVNILRESNPTLWEDSYRQLIQVLGMYDNFFETVNESEHTKNNIELTKNSDGYIRVATSSIELSGIKHLKDLEFIRSDSHSYYEPLLFDINSSSSLATGNIICDDVGRIEDEYIGSGEFSTTYYFGTNRVGGDFEVLKLLTLPRDILNLVSRPKLNSDIPNTFRIASNFQETDMEIISSGLAIMLLRISSSD